MLGLRNVFPPSTQTESSQPHDEANKPLPTASGQKNVLMEDFHFSNLWVNSSQEFFICFPWEIFCLVSKRALLQHNCITIKQKI